VLAYWGLLALLAIGSLLYQNSEQLAAPGQIERRPLWADIPLAFGALTILLMVGLRYKVGGDWPTYSNLFQTITAEPIDQALGTLNSESGYTILNWIAGRAGFGFWLVNLVCALLFVGGLVALARQQPNPWLALVVATPVFIIVVGMGYTRQSAAVGCVLIGLTQIIEGRNFAWFVAWTLLGALFHQSAILMIPLIALFTFRWRPQSLLLLVLIALIMYYVVLPEALDRYAAGYIDATYGASGVLFRVLPNALMGVLLLALRKNFWGSPREMSIWRGFAVLSLIAPIALVFVQSSVIVDRLSLYVLPMQIVVLSTIPFALNKSRPHRVALMASVIFFAVAQQFVWLNYADHARFWVPYRLYPLFA
jgi:hypothetical protein